MSSGQKRPGLRDWLVPVVGGSALLLIGAALLADELGYAIPFRWAFLILLVPAAVALADGVHVARFHGWRSVATLSRLIAGTLFAAIGIMLVLRLNSGIILPLLIILLGMAAIARAVTRRN